MEQGVGGGLDDWDFEEGDVIESNEGSMPSITFSVRVHVKLSEPWKNSVVVKLLGHTIGYRALCARLNGMWKSAMGFSVIDLENNYYLVRFRLVGDAMDALTKGPWLVMGHYLMVQLWTPSFDFTNTALEQVTVWIRLPGLAVHLYDRKVLQKLGQLVGNVITINSNTASSSRGRFASLAVSISLTRLLVSQFELDGKIHKVEYEGLPVICYKCGHYGHSSSNCKDAKNSTSCEDAGQPHQVMLGNEAPGQHAVGSNGDSNVEPFGPWIMAPRRGRKPNNGRENASDLNRNREFTGAGTSRFHILTQVPDEGGHHVHEACTDFPSTSRQPFISASNPTFTAKTDNTIQILARRKLQNKTVVTRNQSRKPNVPVVPTSNPFQPSDFSIREEDITLLPHANQKSNSHSFPQKVSSNQCVVPFATTLDPTKHTMVFCAPQTLLNGDVREVATDHIERQGPDPQHLADPPDDQNTSRVKECGNACNHPAVSMSGVDGDGMTDDGISMVHEMPLALMDDVSGQQQ
ncbi:hypothetical protein WN944_002269 [Citrus x changshan-huyou]|uniref:CCHC-type domain-containing protein n=1 Tax=Citrus x changshan-huyou TaxID=2935761 RepID=A0AAP0MI86_9ROSI